MTFTLVLPIKETGLAKSRLQLDAERRREVVRGFVEHATEVASAAAEVSTIVVVGSVDLVPRHVDVRHVDDPGTGLNPAVGAARSWARLCRPGGPIAVLPIDLPSLTVAELDGALALAAWSRRGFVPDRSGTGTTLVTARSPELLVTAYGPDSARRHRELGLDVLSAEAGLRHDVDTLEDLRDLEASGARSAVR